MTMMGMKINNSLPRMSFEISKNPNRETKSITLEKINP